MITPTQMIRDAALNCGIVTTPTPYKEPKPDRKKRKSEAETVDVDGFTGIKMIDREVIDVPDDECWLCGAATHGKGLPVKKAIKPTFTDRDRAVCGHSDSVCAGCVFCLSYMNLRNYSILAVPGELQHPGRGDIRGLLLEPPAPPFLFCIATSGQKWLHFKGEIAYSQDNYPVQYEDMRVYINRELLGELLELIEQLYTVFTKAEILSGDYSQNRIKQLGIDKFMTLEAKAAPYRGQRLFDLAVFVAQKPPENKKGE